jgi:hypothetical protein
MSRPASAFAAHGPDGRTALQAAASAMVKVYERFLIPDSIRSQLKPSRETAHGLKPH